MNLPLWLDLPLIVLGLLAMSPGIWYVFRLRRVGKGSALGRGLGAATTLLFCFGLGAFTVGGVDAGLAEWNEVCHPRGDANDIQESMLAPDFALPALDEDRTIRLSDFRGQKPVVLIFGNFY